MTHWVCVVVWLKLVDIVAVAEYEVETVPLGVLDGVTPAVTLPEAVFVSVLVSLEVAE